MIKKCCMEDCDNEINTETDMLWDEFNDGYACQSCLDYIGDQ